MMSIITTLHQHPLHNTAHYQSYLKRYHQTDFTALDHYRHLKQVLQIYQALETKISDPAFSPKIPVEFNFVMSRSKEIEKDLAYLEAKISINNRDEKLTSTETYVEELKKLDPKKDGDHQKIFTHFLIRILGDLFGGQGLKDGAIEAYQREKIFDESQPDLGTSFYKFPKNALMDFSTWLNMLILNEAEMKSIGTDSYQKHINIFLELEKTRASGVELKPVTKVAVAKNSASFFNCGRLGTAVAVGTAVLGAGLLITNTLNRFGS